MEVKEYFSKSEGCFPEETARLRRISFALRRGGLADMEVLCRAQAESLCKIRGIGEKSLPLIEKIRTRYREEYPGEWRKLQEKPVSNHWKLIE